MLRWLQSLIWRHSPVLLHLPHIRQLQSELPKEIGTRSPGFLQKHGERERRDRLHMLYSYAASPQICLDLIINFACTLSRCYIPLQAHTKHHSSRATCQ